MTDEFWKSLAVIIPAILGSRWLSHIEHKKTGRDISEIKISLNGELEKRLEQAREQGRQEERNKKS